MGQMSRFIATFDHRLAHRLRQEEGRVGLDHQAIGGDLRHPLAQGRAASLVADPAGDAEMQIQRAAGFDHGDVTGKAVQHRARQGGTVLPQDGEKVVLGIALVQKHRALVIHRQAQLCFEGGALIRAG